MKNPFAKKITRAFAFCIAFLLVCTALSFITLYRAGDKAEWRQHTHIVIQKLELLLSVMKDAETGARGFVITGDERTLDPYRNASRNCKKLLHEIALLTRDNPHQKPSGKALEPVIDMHFNQLKQYIDITRAGKDVSPEDIERGKAVMDNARHIVKQMKEREFKLLAQRNSDWEHTWGLLPWLIALLTIVAVGSTLYFCRNLQISYYEKLKFRRMLQQQAIITANRIKIIQDVTAQIAGGNYAVRLSDDEQDRLGILSSDVNKMTAALEYSFSMLKEWMNKKDEFINITAHELKTPLTSIKAIMQFIGRVQFTADESKKVYPFVQKANHQISRLTSILQDLLEVSRISTGQLGIKPATFNLNEAILNCVEGQQSTLKGHEVILNISDAPVYADRFKIEQVISNLITNAIKYSAPNTPIAINSTEEAGFIKISVTDKGIGIPPDKLPYIFERYFRVEETSQNYSGLGLGLYISKGIIEQHGGQIGAQSIVGQSTTFWFTLPLHINELAGN